MLERAGIVLVVAILVLVAWVLVRWWQEARVRRLSTVSLFHDLIPPDRPAIIAFSTPSCTDCRTRQAPALARLAASSGDSVTIRTLSAIEYPDLVQRLGILTVPATAVVDATGRLRHLNLGYAPSERLSEQLASDAS